MLGLQHIGFKQKFKKEARGCSNGTYDESGGMSDVSWGDSDHEDEDYTYMNYCFQTDMET